MRGGTACPSESAALARPVLHTSVGEVGLGGGGAGLFQEPSACRGAGPAQESQQQLHTKIHDRSCGELPHLVLCLQQCLLTARTVF